MKSGIHPKFYENVVVTCVCGATHAISGTIESLSVEICSKCHPFYTGNVKVIDTAGRVEKFKQRLSQAKK